MWFDPGKLLANANFQDVTDFATTDAGLAGAEGGVGSAGLVPADFPPTGPADTSTTPAAPGLGGGTPAPDALAPMFSESEAGLFGQGAPEVFSGSDPSMGLTGDSSPGTAGGGVPPAAPSDPTSTTSTGPAAFQGVGGKTAGPGDPTAGDTATPLRASDVSGRADIGQPGAGGAANPMAQLANALRGVAQAAQGGNPQAQQLMNMLRQMQMMGGMGGMMGGQQYNPYMSQFMNPWAARMRMEQMRRHFIERERLRRQLYGAPGRPAVGGRRGR